MRSNSYSWNSTSQWSQLPTGPMPQQNSSAPALNNIPNAQTINTSNYSNNQPVNNNYQASSIPNSTPETRRDMITRLYKIILGREPDNDGLNYYLYNTQIPEAQIASEMYESTDHQELLQRAQDVREMIKKLEDEKKQSRDLQTKLANAEALIESYKQLIQKQNHLLGQSNIDMSQYDASSENYYGDPNQYQEDYYAQNDYNNGYYDSNQQYQNNYNQAQYQQNPEDVMLDDPFADDEAKGIKGKLKKWLKF